MAAMTSTLSASGSMNLPKIRDLVVVAGDVAVHKIREARDHEHAEGGAARIGEIQIQDYKKYGDERHPRKGGAYWQSSSVNSPFRALARRFAILPSARRLIPRPARRSARRPSRR